MRLSDLADKAVPKLNESSPQWQWRMLYYYTTFDDLMNKTKMIEMPYREHVSNPEDDPFSDEEDSPTGHQIYYSMSLSLEPSLHVSEVVKNGKKIQSKMPIPIQNPWPFSKGAMEELMIAAQTVMMGKEYQKLDMYKKYEREFN